MVIKKQEQHFLFANKSQWYRSNTYYNLGQDGVIMKITRNSNILIVLPRAATSREIFASEELSKYLTQIFCEIQITTTNDSTELSGDVILIGGPERNIQTARFLTEAQFDHIVPGPEGMLIQTLDDNTLLLAGSSKNINECERGTIYAVYEFLERFLGCSLAAYVNPEIAGGEHIPTLDQIALTDIHYVKASADSIYRTAIVQYADEEGTPVHELNIPFIDWLVKNRYNRILTWASVYESYKHGDMLEEIERRGIRLTVGHHASSQLFLPPMGNEYFPEHYYETHPEYYKLLENGERMQPKGFYGQWIFCSRNEDAISQVSKNIIRWIGQNPAVDIVAFWPQDGIAPQCMCEKCAQFSKVYNYTYFLNAVAKRVSAVYPHVKIDMLIYVDLWERPEGMQLEPSLIIDESTWHESGLRCVGKPDGSGIIGTLFDHNLKKWHEVGAEVVYYDYYMGVYPARQRYIPMADEVQSLCKHFAENGVLGTATQIECFNHWNHLFNFYVFARTAYDNSVSMEEHFPRFSGIFGMGAPFIIDIIRKTEACLDGQVSIMQAGLYLMEHIDKEEIYQLFEAALAAAQTPAHRNNIRMLRMAFRYSELEAQESYGQTGDEPYATLQKYNDPTGELYYMSTQFDSFQWNDPGYGITIPVDCPKSDFMPDHWYAFEKSAKQ